MFSETSIYSDISQSAPSSPQAPDEERSGDENNMVNGLFLMQCVNKLNPENPRIVPPNDTDTRQKLYEILHRLGLQVILNGSLISSQQRKSTSAQAGSSAGPINIQDSGYFTESSPTNSKTVRNPQFSRPQLHFPDDRLVPHLSNLIDLNAYFRQISTNPGFSQKHAKCLPGAMQVEDQSKPQGILRNCETKEQSDRSKTRVSRQDPDIGSLTLCRTKRPPPGNSLTKTVKIDDEAVLNTKSRLKSNIAEKLSQEQINLAKAPYSCPDGVSGWLMLQILQVSNLVEIESRRFLNCSGINTRSLKDMLVSIGLPFYEERMRETGITSITLLARAEYSLLESTVGMTTLHIAWLKDQLKLLPMAYKGGARTKGRSGTLERGSMSRKHCRMNQDT
ncbi:hypothetical protein Ciccas_009020 [Cichlidogyrus casuarinus]|uniref:Uncharacterized protein n=1 Tax=Cichlidogyrus casuarinus TaxID=1844966 RepID=A0ABD2Q101_9PLAT